MVKNIIRKIISEYYKIIIKCTVVLHALRWWYWTYWYWTSGLDSYLAAMALDVSRYLRKYFRTQFNVSGYRGGFCQGLQLGRRVH